MLAGIRKTARAYIDWRKARVCGICGHCGGLVVLLVGYAVIVYPHSGKTYGSQDKEEAVPMSCMGRRESPREIEMATPLCMRRNLYIVSGCRVYT